MRKLKPQLPRIDIDELFNNPSNRGMLSFLERPPEEAKSRLVDKQRVDEADTQRLMPANNVAPVGDLHTGCINDTAILLFPAALINQSGSTASNMVLDGSRSVGNLPPVGDMHTGSNRASNFIGNVELLNQSRSPTLAFSRDEHPEGDLPIGNIPPGVSYQPGELPLEVTNIGSGHTNHDEKSAAPANPQDFTSRPHGNSPRGPIANFTEPVTQRVTYPEGAVFSGLGAIDGAILGRRQKIRRAIVAQDGHSSGEQLLYQSLWNAARPESPDTRLISVGYNGMSALCKLDKSNCKKNIQSLLEKLSVQVAETYQSASSTGTTYRIFSYREILRRREAAGMVWVIRTSGVRFVRPEGDLLVPPVGNLPPDGIGKAPTGSRGKIPTPPVGETHTPLGKDKNFEETTSSIIRNALSRFGSADEDAALRLLRNCRDRAPDCTKEEILHFIDEKGTMTRTRDSRIHNPIGFLIDAVPKCFVGESLTQYRYASSIRKDQHEDRSREVPTVAQEIQKFEHWLEAFPDHPQNDETRRRLAELRMRQDMEQS